jgi:hypothetical protein
MTRRSFDVASLDNTDDFSFVFPQGIADCAIKIVQKEGPMGFFNGFSAYYGRCAPHAMIILLSIESITNAYRKAFDL